MRTIIMAGLAAAGIALTATSGASAAPVNGTVIADLATAPATTVQYYGGYGYGRYGYGGYRGYGYGYRRYGYGYRGW
jgi:hypothetical protein